MERIGDKCIHCGREFKSLELRSWIIIECDNYEIKDYFCPFCNKVMNGYTKVKEKK